MAMRLRRVLMTVILSALGTGALVYWLLMMMVAPGQVVIATRDLPERTGITADMVTVVQLPRAGIHPSALRRLSDVVGCAVMHPIFSGEQILTPKLVEGSLAGRISGQLRSDERAMLIPASPDRAVGGAIAPHDRVDVVFVPAGIGLEPAIPRTLLSDVEVLDVRVPKSGLSGPGLGEGVIVRVSASAAEALAGAISSGDVYLVLTQAAPTTGESSANDGGGGSE
jgi:Flp pilus assembly protein CpaB